MKENSLKKDLQIFAAMFDCKYIKPLPHGIEVRVDNLDTGKWDAQKLIDRLDLDLEISTEGSMVNLRAFLVKPKTAIAA